jgi:7,8-dihydropterin-6-yl-methyl-4-(beta-D-ribofuranosyl)aminobenzene 5'-phosphate synthase
VEIKILVDNNAGDGLLAEHGFSLWIEAEGKNILFDTGQGNSLEGNSRALGVDLGKTDSLVLSHGHFDHTGGIARVFKAAPKADIYCHSGVVQPRYAIRNGTSKSIQMPRESMAVIDKMPSKQLHWVHRPVQLSERIGLTGTIPRHTAYEDTGGPFFLDTKATRPDPIIDDLALWVRTNEGLVVCVGCSHAGLINTLEYARTLSKETRIRAIIGGFHLVNANRDRLERTVSALREIEPAMLVPCHCTGQPAVSALRDALGESVSTGVSGMAFKF